jgi:hypothetical protein
MLGEKDEGREVQNDGEQNIEDLGNGTQTIADL